MVKYDEKVNYKLFFSIECKDALVCPLCPPEIESTHMDNAHYDVGGMIYENHSRPNKISQVDARLVKTAAMTTTWKRLSYYQRAWVTVFT